VLAQNPVFQYEVGSRIVFLCVKKYGVESPETQSVTRWFMEHADPKLLSENMRESSAKLWKWGQFDLASQLQTLANDLENDPS
jgi:hypothetical protein